MESSISKKEVAGRILKIGGILLFIGLVVALIHFGPEIKEWCLNLFSHALQSDIQVTVIEPPEWTEPEAVEVFTKELKECGFEEIGYFTINHSDQVKILAFMHPQEQIYAMVYDKYFKFALLDFYTFYEDGTSIRATIDKNPYKDKPPGKKIWYIEEPMSIREIFEKFMNVRPDGSILPVTQEDFAPTLEQYLEEVSLFESREFMR